MSAAIQVWMSVWRAGNTYHRLTGDDAGTLRTACGRHVSSGDQRHGVIVRDTDAEDHSCGPCERCWPGGR